MSWKSIAWLEESSFSASVARHATHSAIAVGGELDLLTAGGLDAALRDAGREGVGLVLLDLGAVSFIDSNGMRTLLEAEDRARAGGPAVAIVQTSAPVRRLLEIMGVRDRFSRGSTLTGA